MNKNDLIENIFEKQDLNLTKQQIHLVIDLLEDEIKNGLSQGNNIELRGFGTFELRHRKGRENARSPKTGEKVSVPPHYVAAFRAGKTLQEKLKNIKE